jgi:hypothetical protein
VRVFAKRSTLFQFSRCHGTLGTRRYQACQCEALDSFFTMQLYRNDSEHCKNNHALR